METIRVHMPASKKTSTRNTAIVAGLITAGVLIAYFLIMKLFGLHYIFELRYFNAVIMFAGVLLFFQRIKRLNGKVEYLEGLGAGFTMVATSALMFSLFMMAYLNFIDPSFFYFIKENTPTGEDLDVWILTGLIFSEALSSGAIFTFMLMQYFKDKRTEVD